MYRLLVLTYLILFQSYNPENSRIQNIFNRQAGLINPSGMKVNDRFRVPDGYERLPLPENSFAAYLRSLPLKPNGSLVKYYDGRTKPNDNIYAAVVDMEIGNLNLHQCADAVIHLRADYLYHNQRFNDIHFNFTSGFRADYTHWMEGYRIKVNGNKVSWIKSTQPSNTLKTFNQYLIQVYSYAGSLSLSKELKNVKYTDMQIGDVFIRGGSPGHAVIVVDMAINKYGSKIFMIAQSYMPAQEIQILENPDDSKISPWYLLDESDIELITPQWTFLPEELKRFKD